MGESFAFVIVTYNETESTSRLADKLLSWDTEGHIIIVDNCSTDDTYPLLKQKYADHSGIDVIHSNRNGGYGAGNNLGAKYAIENYDVKYVAIANPDIIIEEKDFLALFKAFSAAEVAVSTATMMNLDGTYKTESKKIPSYSDDLKVCFGLSSTVSSAELQYLDSSETFYYSEFIPGSFFVIRSDVFQQIGGFDENVFLFCEERIIGKKLKDAGYRQVIRKDVFFLHAHSVTIKKAYNAIQTEKLILKARLYFEKEYMHIPAWKYCLLATAMKLYIAGLYAVITAASVKRKICKR